jgi:hypothetical protein
MLKNLKNLAKRQVFLFSLPARIFQTLDYFHTLVVKIHQCLKILKKTHIFLPRKQKRSPPTPVDEAAAAIRHCGFGAKERHRVPASLIKCGRWRWRRQHSRPLQYVGDQGRALKRSIVLHQLASVIQL